MCSMISSGIAIALDADDGEEKDFDDMEKEGGGGGDRIDALWTNI